MTWDLATARAVTNTTNDAALTSIMDIVLGTVEDLLGRALLYGKSAETFYHVDTRRFRLHRYPIDRILSVNGNAVSTDILVHHRVGWVELGNCGGNDGRVTIEYMGGFKQLPSALERAMWEAFQALWANSDPVTGHPIAGTGGSMVTQGSGDISRVSLPGGGAVSWDVGATVTGGSGSSASAHDHATWGWLAPWASTLEMYRTESSPSLAFA